MTKHAASLALFVFLFPTLSRGDDEKLTQDEKFFRTATALGVGEVKLGELAEKQAKNEEVREFARHMVKEHKEHNKMLLTRAAGLKTAVVVGLDDNLRSRLDGLSKLEGSAFDRAYMKQIISDHTSAITHFEKQAKEGSHAELKAFAGESLPTLRKHLKKAQSIADNL